MASATPDKNTLKPENVVFGGAISAKKIIEFLTDAGFDRMEWDGHEMTCYLAHKTEPFGIREFTGPTKNRWSKIELALRNQPPLSVSIKSIITESDR